MLIDRELDRNRLINRVGVLTGLSDRDHIERAIEATMEVLAEYELKSDYDPMRFYHEISEREGTSLGFAMEHAQVVLQVVAELIGEEDRQHLVRHLPEELERLVRPPIREPGLAEHEHPGRGTTLASGQPGSQTPLSEAHPDPTHSHSVASAGDPHADTQVSTTQGVKKQESLAEGKPGSERPLSERRDQD